MIDTISACRAAVRHLRLASEVAIDLEGVGLCRTGRISIIQIADPEVRVCLFDVTTLGDAAFSHSGGQLCDLLGNKSIMKVFFDGRADNDALYHLHQVTMKNMFDLHVLQAFKFSSDSDRFVKGLEHCLKQATPLPGMDPSTMSQIKEQGRRLFIPDSGAVWEKRPLPAELVAYAASDVKFLLPLKDKWVHGDHALISKVKKTTKKRIRAAIRGSKPACGDHMARRDFELPSPSPSPSNTDEFVLYEHDSVSGDDYDDQDDWRDHSSVADFGMMEQNSDGAWDYNVICDYD